MQSVLKYANQNRESYLQELLELLKIPSISTDSEYREDVQRTAEWLRVHLLEVGLQKAEIYPTPGLPIVYGELITDPRKPTLLIYGHYDVQPADPLELWQTPPFDPTIKGDYLYARGVADDKGQFFTHLKAIESYLRATGELPVNIKVLLEAEEELGSINLEGFITQNIKLLQADAAAISDSHMDAPDHPRIELGLRGLVYFEIKIRTSDQDLHSGTYGGGVGNAAQVLTNILTKLKNDQNQVTVPGFYDQVLMPDEEESKRFSFNPEVFKQSSRSRLFVSEPGIPPYKMPAIRPSLEINGIVSGYTGQGQKTIVPCQAMAKISTRLVSAQNPDQIASSVTEYIKKLAPKGVEVEIKVMGKGSPVLISYQSQIINVAKEALEETFKHRVAYAREGGSIPVVEIFQRVLGIESALLGYGLPDDNLHAPNERFYIPNFYKGIEANINFYELMGKNFGKEPTG